MNRDHYTRPIQGNGRDAFGYGHTELERLPIGSTWRTDLALWIAIALVGIMFGVLV
jgi:hypothetical protein